MADFDKLKALVVDDSVLYRKIISDILNSFPDVEVVGVAPNGKVALERIELFKPDFITLDFEMPEMDGLALLRKLKENKSEVRSIMISSHTRDGAAVTMQALEEGAFDFVAKPNTNNVSESQKQIRSQIRPIINTIGLKKTLLGSRKPLLMPKPVPPPPLKPAAVSVRATATDITRRMNSIMTGRCEAVGIAISTGGPNALAQVIPSLPGNMKVPVFIVQHMPPVFTAALADSLNKKSAITVVEGADGMPVKAGTVYIAPGGKQMGMERDESLGGQVLIKISDDPPENNCKPAADFMFRSIARTYKGSSLGVIMTGMGADGVKGLLILKKLGTKVIAQDETTCTVFGMPMEAIKAGAADVVVPLEKIADEIVSSIR